jgi:signal transduction histidine kinase
MQIRPTPLQRAAGDSAATSAPSAVDPAALARRAGDALRARFATTVAGSRVAVGLVLAAAFAAATDVGAGSWYFAGATARGLGLLAALGVLVALPGGRRAPPVVVAAGVGLDLAFVVFCGWRALHLPGGLGGGVLGLADLTLAAAMLALAMAQLTVGPALEAQALRLVKAHAGLAAGDEGREPSSREPRGVVREEDLAELVVHDLKNPLAVVLSNITVALDAVARIPGLAQEREALHVAQVEAVRLSGMIGDLLVLPRLERGELRGRFATERIRDLLEAVARATELRAAANDLRLLVDVPPDLVAWIDAFLVRRMVENLVSNALRHASRGGRVELSARVEGGRLRLAVRNDGPAIAAEIRPRLFEKYATHGAGDHRNSGLGLYLCRVVAELHGGRIGIVEREGWSVSFEAELPLVGRSEGSARPASALARPNGAHHPR